MFPNSWKVRTAAALEQSHSVDVRPILLRMQCLLVATTTRLQSMTVTGSSEDGSIFFLAAHKGILHPRVGQDVVHGGTLARIQFQHAANNVSRLTRQQTEQAHRALDSTLLARGRRLARWLFVVVLVMALLCVSASRVARCRFGLCAAVSVRGH